MKKKLCIAFKKGNCLNGNNCKFIHEKKISLLNKKFQIPEFSNEDLEESIKLKYKDFRKVDDDINCKDFLLNECTNKSCTYIHNFSLKNKEKNNREFQNVLINFQNDFKLIEPYEMKLIGKSSLDLLFLCDCTASMSQWIENTKNTIYGIIAFIRSNNKNCEVRIGFVGYRDVGDNKRYEILNFCDDVGKLYSFISGLKADGGTDIPEDVTGGLIKGLNLSWKSNAKYAILIADAPDHGYSHSSGDRFPTGINSHKMNLLQTIQQYAKDDINFYGVELSNSTKYMFAEMSNAYQKIAKKPIHLEDLRNSKENFAFFVAYGASSTLTSSSYSKLDFMQIIKNFLSITQTSISLSKDYDKLSQTEKSVVDFVQKIKEFNDVENEEGFQMIEKDSFGFFDNTIKSELIVNDLQYEEIIERVNLCGFNDISEIEFQATCHSFNIFNDFNSEINWNNPVIQHSKISSLVKLDFIPFSKGKMRYAYYMYDSYLNQKLVGKLPIKYNQNEYNLEFLSRDIESLIIADHLANEFNERIINIIKDKRLLLNFVRAYVYEINFNLKDNLENEKLINEQIILNNFNLFIVENYIDGDYEKYNNNAGWISGNINEVSFIVQAFSHFTWQYTKGYMMIVDLQGVKGILTDPQIHCINSKKYGKGNLGYLGMMKFFLTHTCNQYCLALDLIHPKKYIKNVDIKSFEFFVNKIKIPTNKSNQIFKCCDLCKIPAPFTEYFLYSMKRSGKECFCAECLENLRSTVIEKICKNCEKNFIASEYGFKLKRMEIPENCGECRLMNRKKLRLQIEQRINDGKKKEIEKENYDVISISSERQINEESLDFSLISINESLK